jgi:hypothetical protein
MFTRIYELRRMFIRTMGHDSKITRRHCKNPTQSIQCAGEHGLRVTEMPGSYHPVAPHSARVAPSWQRPFLIGKSSARTIKGKPTPKQSHANMEGETESRGTPRARATTRPNPETIDQTPIRLTPPT